jgi:hypothetical protein
MQQAANRFEISISKTIAESLNLVSFIRVAVEKIDEEKAWLDFCELTFKKQYLQVRLAFFDSNFFYS